nr:hypothetical protein KK1_002775 [Ipomoea batatas]GMD36580.1 hypothetical protein KK1_002775 [Ipomoea batatas]GMD38201.1 hypothetical protein KK1_002775 [Ipomoea batatas]
MRKLSPEGAKPLAGAKKMELELREGEELGFVSEQLCSDRGRESICPTTLRISATAVDLSGFPVGGLFEEIELLEYGVVELGQILRRSGGVDAEVSLVEAERLERLPQLRPRQDAVVVEVQRREPLVDGLVEDLVIVHEVSHR